jgi:membrane fusion protein, copper/silver efflux system
MRAVMRVVVGSVLVGAGVIAGLLWPDRQTESPPAVAGAGAGRQALFYRHPMDAGITSPVPAKDAMGMDYIPVYAADGTDAGAAPGIRVPSDTRQSLGVRTAPVRRVALGRTWQATGVLTWDESRITHLHTRVPGWVRHLHVHALGERVRAGQVLATLDSNVLDAAQREHLVALQAGDAPLAAASRERLGALGMTPAQVAALERAGRSSRAVAVRAPTDGVVIELGARHGMYVTPETELFALAPLDRLWVDARLLERQAGTVQVGDDAQVELAQLPGPPRPARVEYVYPQLDAATRAPRVRLSLDNPDGALRADMWVRVRGQAPAGAAVLAVPDAAVIRTGEGERVVLALGEGRFDVREVRTGRRADGLAEVVAGLEAGQRVVTSAQFLLDAEADVQAALRAMGPGTARSGADAPAPGAHAASGAHEAHDAHDAHDAHPAPGTAADSAVQVRAVVRGVDPAGGTLTLEHPAIEALGMPAMTMPFAIGAGVDVSGLKPGDGVRVGVSASPRGYAVTALVREAGR